MYVIICLSFLPIISILYGVVSKNTKYPLFEHIVIVFICYICYILNKENFCYQSLPISNKLN